MSDYRRLISYIYEYEGKEKGKNIGFVKLEARNGQCRLNLNVKKIYVGGNAMGVFLLSKNKEETFLGNIFIRNGGGEFRATVDARNVEGSGNGLDTYYGLTIHDVKNPWRSYATIWEDAVARTAQEELPSSAGAGGNRGAISGVVKEIEKEIEKEIAREEERRDEENAGTRAAQIGWSAAAPAPEDEAGGSGQAESENAVIVNFPRRPPTPGPGPRRPGGGFQRYGIPPVMPPTPVPPAPGHGPQRPGMPPIVPPAPGSGPQRPGMPPKPPAPGPGPQRPVIPPPPVPPAPGSGPQRPGMPPKPPAPGPGPQRPGMPPPPVPPAPGHGPQRPGMPSKPPAPGPGPGPQRPVIPPPPVPPAPLPGPQRPGMPLAAPDHGQQNPNMPPTPVSGPQNAGPAPAYGAQTPGMFPMTGPAPGEPEAPTEQNAERAYLETRDVLPDPREAAPSPQSPAPGDFPTAPQEPEDRSYEPGLEQGETVSGQPEGTDPRTGQETDEKRKLQAISPELENPEVLKYLQDAEGSVFDPEQFWQEFRKEYPKIQPFDYDDGCEILTIKPHDIGRLPREIWVYGNNSFLLHGYYSFRYLILARLGSRRGKPRYLLGVPGHYYSNEKYMASMFGFPNFVLSKRQPPNDGRFGYWYTDIRMG